MQKYFNFINNGLLGFLATFCDYLFGGFGVPLQTLITFVALDIVTGIVKAYHTKTVASGIIPKGIRLKLGNFVVVIVASFVDRILVNTGTIRDIVIYSFIANEGISILENWGEIGLPLPKQLINALQKLKNLSDDKVLK